jgi:hypothetical protein
LNFPGRDNLSAAPSLSPLFLSLLTCADNTMLATVMPRPCQHTCPPTDDAIYSPTHPYVTGSPIPPSPFSLLCTKQRPSECCSSVACHCALPPVAIDITRAIGEHIVTDALCLELLLLYRYSCRDGHRLLYRAPCHALSLSDSSHLCSRHVSHPECCRPL